MLFIDSNVRGTAGQLVFRAEGSLKSATIEDVPQIVALHNGDSSERLLAFAYTDAIKARAVQDGGTGKFAEITAAIDAALNPSEEKDIPQMAQSLYLPGMDEE